MPAAAFAQKLVFIARHAERADDPVRDQQDPALSAAGKARAAKLSVILQDAGVRAIYVTAFKRTKDTAQPLAAKLTLTPELMPATVPALVTTMKINHANDVVLIVGHTSTIPAIVKALGGPVVTLGDAEYDSLFVVVPATGTVSKIRY